MDKSDYEVERQQNIQRNKDALKELGIEPAGSQHKKSSSILPGGKKRKLEQSSSQSVRKSARIAESTVQPRYVEDLVKEDRIGKRIANADTAEDQLTTPSLPPESLVALVDGWKSWSSVASLPVRGRDGKFHFDSHPTFTPNKSPAEIIREGAFGGGYFRPIWSQKLRSTIRDDYLDTFPLEWREGLNVGRYLTSAQYDPHINKFGVSCGQSYEEWEKSGWIEHRYDVRGWFQWYCRFFRGRRCEDDDRQVGRWDRCVGNKGRWKRTLLNKYVRAGVRSVIDEDLDGGKVIGLSPVVHQTCQHWAYSITQAGKLHNLTAGSS